MRASDGYARDRRDVMEPMAKQLVDAHQSGMYQLVRSPEEVERTAKDARLAIFLIDMRESRGKKDFLGSITKAIRFPDWFGDNWDVLNDCLTDIDWLPTKAVYVLIFE